MGTSPVLEICDLTKKFPGVVALKKVNLSIEKGEIRALVGENGAGKSTVAKVIASVYPPTEGRMLLNGKPYGPHDILDAHTKGVSIIYQEPNLVPCLTVSENIFLDSLSSFARYGFIDRKRLYTTAADLLNKIGATEIDPQALITRLTVGQRKLVELARAVSRKPDVLIVDETTSALNAVEVRLLFENMQGLKARGTSFLYISHRLEEVFRLCDTVTVLRDGEVVKTLKTSETNISELSSLMVGRQISMDTYYRNRSQESFVQSKPVLEVEGLTCTGQFEDVSFSANAGEIVGIGGLIGSGNEGVLEALFGVLDVDKGQVKMHGEKIRIRNPSEAIANGIAYVPKERDEEGLIPLFSVKENICMAVLRQLMNTIVLDYRAMSRVAEKYRNRLEIKTQSIESSCMSLSGGNRQKVVLAKWLASNPRALLLNNATRGIDVGAKSEVYKLVNELAQSGLAVVMACDELPELIGMSDELLIMRKGRISHVFHRQEHPREEDIISWML